MVHPPLLRIDGEVACPMTLSFADLAALDEQYQIRDVSRLIPKRHGDAVQLAGLLALVRPNNGVDYLGLHSSQDNFHASIPLEPVRDQAIVIYRLNGQPLSIEDGGPVRFYIPNHSHCHTSEIDECANVKFVDHIELTRGRGFDNRPTDEDEHARLHEKP